MGELWGGRTRSLKNEQMFEGVGKMILPADHVRDLETDIVGAGGQVIGWHTAAPQQRKILDISGQFRLRTIHLIVEGNLVRRFANHSKAYDERLSGGGASVAFGL